MKKVEIIIDKAYYTRVIDKLDQAGVSGYSVLEVYKGKGGMNDETFNSGAILATKNLYLISLVNAAQAEVLQHSIAPILQETGGLLMIGNPDFAVAY